MARGGGPGANSRGRGGKFRKPTRGGGKHFSRDLRPLDADGNEIGMWGAGKEKEDSSDEDESSEEESEEESDDEAGPSNSAAQEDLSREERKKEKKARKEAAIARAKAAAIQVGDLPPSDSEEEEVDDMPANPNHSKAARKQLQAPTEDEVEEATKSVSKMSVSKQPQSRRERESMEAAQAKERYMKLHLAGKTEQAQADMERLRAIREKREAERARKEAEREEKEEQDKVRRAEIEAKEAKKREAALGKAPAKKGSKKTK
ncbi:hypothetical protein VP1G_05539 [Cytospora mali]|uniref:Casein kinase substrate phosphoprotein PP28 domain-containing protein n=1 Tax=Cytospora mali TaxID=578113 RepID=A0A194V2Q3_CYTMA|nr:hypothetical protein VP1G_05539 [Valsa mali var. pyri (nom. inval.)]